MSTPPPFKGAGTPPNFPGTNNDRLLSNHPSLGRRTTGQTDPSSSTPAVPVYTTASLSTSSRNPHRSASRPNRCEHCLLFHRRCDGVHPQCGECKKKDRICVWPTTGEETISRSQMERRVAERQQREPEQKGFVGTNVSESTEGEGIDDDDVEMEGLGQAERRFEQGIFTPVGSGLVNFGSGMQEEDLFPLGTSRRRPDPSTREDGDGSGVGETLALETSRRRPGPPTREDTERSYVDERVPVMRGVKRRQPGGRWERKKSPEGERIGRYRVKVARTAEAVGATLPEPEEEEPPELALGETGIVTVTDQSFVREHGVNIEGVNIDSVETDNALPSATEPVFNATTRLFDDRNSDLQAPDCSVRGTTTHMSLNWHTQPSRHPNGTHNPVISADSAVTFLPAVPRQGDPAGTPTAEELRQRQESPVLTERDTSLEELDANEFEVAEELTQAGGDGMRGEAGQEFVENFEAIERAGPSTAE